MRKVPQSCQECKRTSVCTASRYGSGACIYHKTVNANRTKKNNKPNEEMKHSK